MNEHYYVLQTTFPKDSFELSQEVYFSSETKSLHLGVKAKCFYHGCPLFTIANTVLVLKLDNELQP
jgi:hypothetical protein